MVLLFWLCFPLAALPQINNRNPLEHTRVLIKQNPDAAFLQIKRILNEALEEQDDYVTAMCYEQIGEVYYYQAAYSQALDNYYKALKLFQRGKHAAALANTLIKIGETHYYNRQYPAALEIFQEALALYSDLDNHQGMADAYGHIGQAYEKSQNYEQAYRFQNLALQQLSHVEDQSGIAKIYENIGSIYEDKLQLDTALHYFMMALDLNIQQNNQMAQIEIINNIGDVYRKTSDYEEALRQTRRAARLADTLNEHYQLASAYRDLSRTFGLMGRYDSAYHYSELGRDIFLTIFSEDNKKQLTILQTLFEMEQKDDAISQFRKDRRIYGILTTGAVVIIILLVSLGFSIISRQRLKLQNEQQLHEQNSMLYEAQKKALETDLHNKQLKEENLKAELELKSKELTTHTLHLIQKNQLLEELKNKLHHMIKDDKRDQRKELKQLIGLINFNSNQDKNWDDFRIVFERVHEHFFDSLKKHSDALTSADFRLAALLKMNLSSADIATMLGISQDSLRISRYRLRKKLNLEEGENLGAFIQRL
ncbi:tetratricopeptide repeat protein [Parapedobacter deserti]|uniref:Tetratricopeptide repeat protein n=1 Tax=Parapedobacter deserti TaxID=1912957 RepID=A0ABV7JVF3_9SPHI